MQTQYELDSLSHAKNYQKWMFESVKPYLGKRILELGSGIGNLSVWLPVNELLVLSEVEQHFIQHLQELPSLKNEKTKIIQMDLSKSMADQVKQFNVDTIVSFNVMEHIENDFQSFQDQIRVLKESKAVGDKSLVVFAPALNFAFGSLDRIFLHFRRYDAGMVESIFKRIDPKLKLETHYFNVLTLPAWIIQGKVFKKKSIGAISIKVLEYIIPLWKPIDWFLTRVLRLPFGQSLVFVVKVD